MMRSRLLAHLRRLPEVVRQAWAARSGSLTTITAFSVIPIVGFIGLSVDYGMELAAKSKLDHAADAAVIAAITSAQTYIVNYTGSGDPTTNAIAVGKDFGNGLSASLALVDTDAEGYLAPNGKDLGKAGAVLGVKYSF